VVGLDPATGIPKFSVQLDDSTRDVPDNVRMESSSLHRHSQSGLASTARFHTSPPLKSLLPISVTGWGGRWANSAKELMTMAATEANTFLLFSWGQHVGVFHLGRRYG